MTEKKKSGPATNTEFAANDGAFRKACQKAGVEPSRRQASKFRRKMGRAYRASQESEREGRD